MSNPDFYETDEPAEKIWAAFNSGEKGMAHRPERGIRIGSSASVTFQDCWCSVRGQGRRGQGGEAW